MKPPRHRSKGPYFKNRIEDSKRKAQTNLKATSKATGIEHTFGNIEGWEKLMDAFDQKAKNQRTQLYTSVHFYSWLKEQAIDKAHCSIQLEAPCFRFANPNFGPIALEGSLSHGGRFNVGGAQLDGNFPDLQMFGCLYVASSEECAKEEAAKPIGAHNLYKLVPKKPLILWDLAKVISRLNYINLLDLVKASHGEKIWAYQKVPTEPQILAHELQRLGGDGLIFDSTKKTGHQNIALFFKNNDTAKDAFDISLA